MSRTATPHAAFFDFDGVLADAQNVHVAAWERTFHRMGLNTPPLVCAQGADQADRPFLVEVLRDHDIQKADLDGWVAYKQDLTRAMLSAAPRLYLGVTTMLHALRELGWKLAVVSSGRRDDVSAALESAGLLGEFAWIAGREDAPHDRPDPTGHLQALEHLHVDPKRAVTLEASPVGIQAGRAAGIRAIAVGHRSPPGDWTQDASYLSDFL